MSVVCRRCDVLTLMDDADVDLGTLELAIPVAYKRMLMANSTKDRRDDSFDPPKL